MNNLHSEKSYFSVVLGSFNRKPFLKLTIDSVRKELSKLPFKSEIIVVDGGSSDGTVAWLTSQKDIVSIIQHNRGEWLGKPITRRSWGYFMNLGFKSAEGKYICMLSDDSLVFQDAFVNAITLLEESEAKNENIGALAFYFRNLPLEKDFSVYFTLGNTMVINHGIFLKKALEDVGYIDENLYKFYHGDDDLALKITQKGYTITDSPNSFIDHFLHANIVLREQVYQTEKNDFLALINKWRNVFNIPSDQNIHSSKHLVFNTIHEHTNKYFEFYKKDLRKIKLKRGSKKLGYKSRKFLKNKIMLFYYAPKYIINAFSLLFKNPKAFKEKLKNTKKKYSA